LKCQYGKTQKQKAMKTVNDFTNLKNTKTTYNKVLDVAQKITLTRTVEFTETGKMRDLTLEEREIFSLCDSLSDAHKQPACIKRMHSDITFYVELSKKYPAKC
jgi:hypothetical protein